jgi:F-type H+-transporting ATPase subunit c
MSISVSLDSGLISEGSSSGFSAELLSRFAERNIAVQREGASTVSINHPLAANFGRMELYTMRKMQFIFMSLATLLLASPAFAQAAGTTSPSAQWVPLAAGLGMALASGLCGIGQGKATASATEALARNPGARPGIFLFLILGLAFIESLALYTFVIIFIKVK